MTQHFTTPEFAQVLKQHGIEIDTPFGIDKHKDIFAISEHGDCISLIDGATYSSYRGYTYPAYPLTQVLGWLPKTLIEHLKPTNTPSHRPDYLSYPMVSDMNEGVIKIGYKSEYYGTQITPLPIEALIIQGLTEGWLNKDNLNLAK